MNNKIAKCLDDRRKYNKFYNKIPGSGCPFTNDLVCKGCKILFPEWEKNPTGNHPCDDFDINYVVKRSKKFIKCHLKERGKLKPDVIKREVVIE